jgi:hypothetical protein
MASMLESKANSGKEYECGNCKNGVMQYKRAQRIAGLFGSSGFLEHIEFGILRTEPGSALK